MIRSGYATLLWILSAALLIAWLVGTLILLVPGEEPPEEIKAHLVLIPESTQEPIWQDLYQGALYAAEEKQYALELMGPDWTNTEEHLRWFRIAVACAVDGIILPAVAEDSYGELINQATETGIPVITVLQDAEESSRAGFAGVDRYTLGRTAGRLLKESLQGRGSIAIIANRASMESQSSKNTGFMAGIEEYLADSPELRVEGILDSPNGVFSAEQISREIILENRFDAVYCDSVSASMGVLQMIVDLNAVNRLKVIGFMRNDEIDRYLARGIMQGTLYANPFDIGKDAVELMHLRLEELPHPGKMLRNILTFYKDSSG